MKKAYIWTLIFSFFISCKNYDLSFLENFYYFFFPKKQLDPCDPFYSYYENKSHFFESDNLKSDGTIDYYKLFLAKRPENNPCDPLYSKNQNE
ncbi:MAG: hypothetical protein ACK4UJ_02960 [Leptonema sp. (in: bacteria)]